ncbi:MAG: hypothetical protein QNJ16_11145 [Rhodobacter sp.]|nr:hypothetical protein [Rhodobacter sp.]
MFQRSFLPAAALATLLAPAAAANICENGFGNSYSALLALARNIHCSAGEAHADCRADREDHIATVRASYSVIADAWPDGFTLITGPKRIAPRRGFAIRTSGKSTLIGTPVLGRRVSLDFVLTGGGARSTLTVHICLVDPETGEVPGPARHRTTVLAGGAQQNSGTTITELFGNATGMIPVVVLARPTGTRTHDYSITVAESGTPNYMLAPPASASGTPQMTQGGSPGDLTGVTAAPSTSGSYPAMQEGQGPANLGNLLGTQP